MSLSRPLSAALVAAGILVLAPGAGAQPIVPKDFDPPGRTTWVPEGCRAVRADADALASRETMRNFHSDEVNSDEVAIALAPVFRNDWTTENETWNATGPVFDSAGNLYFTPVLPYENVALISLDPNDGSRRFSVPNTTGAPAGVGSTSGVILTNNHFPDDADPVFASPATWDFHLQALSLCRDAGAPATSVDRDVEWRTRDDSPDIRAWEYQGSD